MINVQRAIARDEITNKPDWELLRIFQNAFAYQAGNYDKGRFFETHDQARAYWEVSRSLLIARGWKTQDLYK